MKKILKKFNLADVVIVIGILAIVCGVLFRNPLERMLTELFYQKDVQYVISVSANDAKLIAEACDDCGFKDYSFGKDMEECVKICHELAEEGDNVLLSPACASWDMYKNFEQRGDHFKGIVAQL